MTEKPPQKHAALMPVFKKSHFGLYNFATFFYKQGKNAGCCFFFYEWGVVQFLWQFRNSEHSQPSICACIACILLYLYKKKPIIGSAI